MLVNLNSKECWAYMEIPRTGSTTIDKKLRELFPEAKAPVGKHWPCHVANVLAPLLEYVDGCPPVSRVVTIRNPYSRAVSCWQFFTVPHSISFDGWLRDRLDVGFTDIMIEARPQSFWYALEHWTDVLHNETLEVDLKRFLSRYNVPIDFELKKLNASGSSWRNKLGFITTPVKDYSVHYTPQTIQLVQKLYLDDFNNLGYNLSFDAFMYDASVSRSGRP